MESNEVSEHLCRVFSFVARNGGWVSAKDIAEGAVVAPRTARHHASRLAAAGIFDQAEVFPGHRYRLAAKADKRNKGLVDRIKAACGVLGVT